jgi:hypothetical protein
VLVDAAALVKEATPISLENRALPEDIAACTDQQEAFLPVIRGFVEHLLF